MTIKNSHKKRYLNQVILAAMLSGLGSYASAAELTLVSQVVSLNNVQTTVAGNGLAASLTDVSANNYGIPDYSFTMTPTGLTEGGVYNFKVGVTLDDDNTSSRVEVFFPSLDITVTGGNLDGRLTQGSKIVILARDADNTVVVDKTLDVPATSPITVVNNKFDFDMDTVINAITAEHSGLLPAKGDVNSARRFTYAIAMEETTTAGIQVGLNTGTFAALPRIHTTCSANPSSQSNAVFTLKSGALAGNFAAAYGIQGQYGVVGTTDTAGAAPAPFTEDCGGGTTTPTEPTVEQDTAEQDTANEQIANDLENSETVSPETAEKLNDAVDSGAALAEKTTENIANTSTDQALTALTTVNKSLELAGTATQKNGAIDTGKAVTTIDNVAKTLAAVNDTKTLSAADVAKIDALASNTVQSASNLVAANSTSADILSIVKASVSIVAQASKANNKVVSAQLSTQVTALVGKAVTGVINNLPASVTSGVNLANKEEVKTLMRSNPSVLAVALAASASLPSGTSISIGGVTLTLEEILAQNLAGGSGTAPALQGGLNFQAATAGEFTVSTDPVTGTMTISSTAEKYVAHAPVSRLVSDAIPEGITYLANGAAVLTGNGVSTELAPTAFDQAGFTNAVTDAGFQLTYRNNGTISIALGNNERFSGAFAYDNLHAASSCGALSIAAPTGDPASASYAFVVNCANGVSQRVTPIADNETFYATVANADLNVSTDRNTGIVTIKTVGSFKPSFFVNPLSAADTTYYEATKNADGIAFRASDKNGDGKVDYEIISANGIQVMYGL